MSDKHRQHCTCPNCSKTGMTMAEQHRMWNGTGSRLIAACSTPVDVATCDAVERIQLQRHMHRDIWFGHYPN